MAASLGDQIKDLMASFNPGSTFGIDIGNHAVKVAEISGAKGKFKVEKFGMHPISEASLIDDEIAKPDDVIEAIEQAMKKAGITSKVCNLGLFGPNVMAKRISIPADDEEELEDTIVWESQQYITFGADDAEIDYHVIGNTEGGGKDVVIAAARNDLIDRFQKLIASAKLKLKNLDLNFLALNNLFEEIALKNEPEYNEGTAIIDYGSQTIKILIYKNNGPIFMKELSMGGVNITEEIQRQLAISYDEAEDIKSTVDDQGNPPAEIMGIVESILATQIQEIKKNLNFYLTAGSAEPIQYILLTGGTSQFQHLPELMTNEFGIEVKIFDPFEMGLKIGGGKTKGQEDVIRSMGLVACGLGLRKS